MWRSGLKVSVAMERSVKVMKRELVVSSRPNGTLWLPTVKVAGLSPLYWM